MLRTHEIAEAAAALEAAEEATRAAVAAGASFETVFWLEEAEVACVEELERVKRNARETLRREARILKRG